MEKRLEIAGLGAKGERGKEIDIALKGNLRYPYCARTILYTICILGWYTIVNLLCDNCTEVNKH